MKSPVFQIDPVRPSAPIRFAFSIILLLAFAFFPLPALRAQQAPAPGAQDAEQAARAIRLSYVDGKVQLAQNGQVLADQAVINTPLVQGETLTTAEDGKAEIQFEDGSVARLSPNSSLTLTTLTGAGSSAEAEMTLDRGLAYFELQGNGQAGQMSVRFDDSVVTTSGFTVLRIEDDTPPGSVAVFSGNAHIDRGSSLSLDIHGGESVFFTANDPTGYNLAETIEPDSWDAWNSDRDQALNAEASSQTAAPSDLAAGQTSNPAWSDLDASGSWYNVPDQGYVWSPYEAADAGFDPYGNGNWVWTPGFGYTWASAYPWGYLPYSCGAWNYYNSFGWGWAPGFGGCTPWWGLGFYGGPFIGFAPGWYHPIHRPIVPHPIRPGHHPIPLIAVNRHIAGPAGALPARGRSTPVNIGGARVAALRAHPTGAARPTLGANGFASSPSGFAAGRPAYAAPRSTYDAPAQRPAYSAPLRNGFAGSPQYPRDYAPPASHNHYNYTPSAPPRTYAPPPSHPAGGNFGGYHSSGGGGASHGGGGGSGSHR